MKPVSVKIAEGNTVTGATQSTLSQSVYEVLRQKLLDSAPPKKAKESCPLEIRQQKAREAMQKKRIPNVGGKEIARRFYGRKG